MSDLTEAKALAFACRLKALELEFGVDLWAGYDGEICVNPSDVAGLGDAWVIELNANRVGVKKK